MTRPSDATIARAFWALTANGDSEIDAEDVVNLAREMGEQPGTAETDLFALIDEFAEVPLIHEDCYDFVKRRRHDIITALRSLT